MNAESFRERTETFINSLYKGNPGYLNDMERDARDRFINVIRPGTQSVIRVVLEMQHPRRILEIGTAVGFSALFMTEYSDASVFTIEHDPERAAEAEKNFEIYGRKDRITVAEGEAEDIIKGLDEKFDLIFLDGAKGQYIRMLPELMRLLGEGGVMITDNVLHEGEIMESRYLNERRDRTIHKRMREFLRAITESSELETMVLPSGDGTAVSVRKRNK